MSKKHLTIILLLSCTLTNLAQRPMTKEVIESKFDSILKESDILYNHSTVYNLTKQQIEKSITHHDVIIEGNDTITISVVNDSDIKIFENRFVYQDTLKSITTKTFVKELDDYESFLLHLKRKLIKEVKRSDYNIDYANPNNLHYILFPNENGYKFYVLSESNHQDTMVMDNDFLFYVNKYGEIKSYKEFHPKRPVSMYLYKRLGDPVTDFVIRHSKKDPLIFASDIATFRLAKRPKESNQFSIVNQINVGFVIKYYALQNKLSFER